MMRKPPGAGKGRRFGRDQGEQQASGKSETYVTLSRGLREHLAKLSGNATKLYVLLLIDAKFAEPDKGKVAASFKDLAVALGIHKSSVVRAARELRPHYIRWQSAANQYGVTIFTVQRYKVVADFAGAPAHQQKSASTTSAPAERVQAPPAHQRVYSTARNPHGQQGLSASNKGEKREEEAAAATAVVGEAWKALDLTSPIGRPPFRQAWAASYATRNGQPVSLVMEQCITRCQDNHIPIPGNFFPLKRTIEAKERHGADPYRGREMVKARID